MDMQQEWLLQISAAQTFPKSAAGHVLGGSVIDLITKASSREEKDTQRP